MNRSKHMFVAALTRVRVLASMWLMLVIGGLIGCASNTPAPEGQAIAVPSSKVQSRALAAAASADYARAQTLLGAGDFAKAKPLLAQVTRSSPGYLPAWVQYAQSLSVTGDSANAVTAIDHARQLGPDDAALLNIAGVIYANAGHYKKAEVAHTAAVGLAPSCAACQFNLGRFYDIYYQDIARALVHYQAYLDNSATLDEALVSWVDELKRNLARQNP